MKHNLPAKLRDHTLELHVVGAGGNGAQMVNGLARLDVALRALGHPGIHVTLFDPDTVSTANVGRQLFSPADVGQHKATVLINRLNAFFGTRWDSVPQEYGRFRGHFAGIVIGCVDTARARRTIFSNAQRQAAYWLDLGNKGTEGQVILGQPIGSGSMPRLREKKFDPHRLPTVLELFPRLTNKRAKEDNTPSCSLAEALEKQDLFINQSVATFALHLLWTWFRQGYLEVHGYFINLKSGRVAPLPIDPQAWQRFNPALPTAKPKRDRVGRIIKPAKPKRGTRSAKPRAKRAL